jgi:hypothetical protein
MSQHHERDSVMIQARVVVTGALLCILVAAHTVICQPPANVYGPIMNDQKWTTRTNGPHAQGAAGLSTALIRIGQNGGYLLQGYLGWTFVQSTLPSEATVTKAKIQFRAFRDPNSCPDHISFFLHDVGLPIGSSSAYDLYDAMDDENKILNGTTATVNDAQIFADSSTALQQAVQTALTSGYLTLGIKNNPETGAAYHWDIADGSDVSTATLQVWFTAPQYSITFRNDLDGSSQGDITVNSSSYASGTSLPLYWGDQMTVQAYGGKYQRSGESYMFHGWDLGFSNGQNPRGFTVTDNSPVVAYFTPVYTVTVANSLDGTTGGHIVYENVEYTNSHTEQDIFRDHTRGFSAISPQTDGGTTWAFDRWVDGSTSISRSINVLASGTYTAFLKGSLRSSLPGASSPNNQRKICYITGAYHMVYESAGEIWYCNSTDNGSTWGQERRLSDGSGMNRTPSIACDPKAGGFPYLGVVWEKYNAANAYSEVYIIRSDNGTNWGTPELTVGGVSGIVQGSIGAMPVLTMEPNFESVVWAVNCQSEGWPSGLYMWTNNILNDYKTFDVITSTDDNSLYPSICEHPYGNYNGRIGIAWAQSGEIKYCMATYDLDRDILTYSSCETVSSGSPRTNHDRPSFAFERNGPTNWRPVVAWQAYNSGTEFTRILERRKESGGWGTITEYSRSEDFGAPSIVPYEGSSDLTMTWYEPNGYDGRMYLAKYTGSWASRIQLTASGRCPTLGYDGYSTTDQLRVLYTTGSNAPYTLGTTNQSLPKADGAGTEVVRRSVTAIADGIAHTVTVEGISIAKGGVKSGLVFGEIPDSLVATSTEDVAAFLESEPVTVSSGSTFVFDVVSSGYIKNANVKNSNSSVIQNIEIIDDASGLRFSSTPFDTLNGADLSARSRSLSLSLSPYAGKKVRVRIAPSVTSDAQVVWGLTEIHDDTSNAQRHLVKQTPGEVVENVPTSFELRPNYPNPFNPSTTIDYQMPEEGIVRLAIYDMLGREVVELVRGSQPAGYYSVRWDASSVASGIYYARFVVTNGIGGLQYSKVNKLLLMK